MKNVAALLIASLSALVLAGCTTFPAPSQPLPPTATRPLSTPAPTGQNDSRGQPYAVSARPQMASPRAGHTATLLPNGAVLITGGFAAGEQTHTSAEIFDPSTGSFSSTGKLGEARQSHTATLLPTGKVLIAGGFNGDYLASAELYDPKTGRFTQTGSMDVARSGHRAILLKDGKVLVAGGTGIGWTFLDSAELYDPTSGTFSPTGPMAVPRESHTATLLADGSVLIAGGHQGRRAAIEIYDSAERYDPISGTFAATGPMGIKRHKHDITRLADGRVLITGGADERDSEGVYTSAEIYDPATGTFTPAGVMQSPRYKHTGTSLLLPDGQVLLTGGGPITELFDPASGLFQVMTEGVNTTRLFATATLLPDGAVLVAGGYGTNIAASSQAWILRAAALE